MSDAVLGFLLLGIAMLVVLGIVFFVASRGEARERPSPPPGVHMPNPSLLPILISVGAALLGAGFAFKGTWAIANPFLAVPGVFAVVATAVAWVRAANREWIEVDGGAHHDDGAGH